MSLSGLNRVEETVCFNTRYINMLYVRLVIHKSKSDHRITYFVQFGAIELMFHISYIY